MSFSFIFGCAAQSCDRSFCPTCGDHAHLCDASCGYCHPPEDWLKREDGYEVCFRALHAGIQQLNKHCVAVDPDDASKVVVNCGAQNCGNAVAQIVHATTVSCKAINVKQYEALIGPSVMAVAHEAQQQCAIMIWNACDSAPCGPGACTVDSLQGAGAYTCSCPHEFRGNNCEISQNFSSVTGLRNAVVSRRVVLLFGLLLVCFTRAVL